LPKQYAISLGIGKGDYVKVSQEVATIIIESNTYILLIIKELVRLGHGQSRPAITVCSSTNRDGEEYY
jgi:hypothetical protein